ncbi:glutaminase [Planktosalinus lacus]|uniref:Glutaminase n=1 Tax=Planktosalinus lacus TaxID=1526573 RepID=A0A8J2V965_9FLAO|nr:glutaminase [Planktosalinus lacus]GGD87891.1 glutaminase [Planktosalinus lacus]
MNYSKIIHQIEHELQDFPNNGKVASYIPELSKVDPEMFGLHLYCIDGNHHSFGDSTERFSIQSISKVFSLTLAMQLLGDDLWKRMDVEPSGNAYNSLFQLERENGIPRNPFINSGALVISDILVSEYDNPKDEILKFVRKISGKHTINFNEKVAQSEKQHGHRNAALANLMKSFGNIKNDINAILDVYFYQCSLAMSCEELASAFMLFANEGKILETNEQVILPIKVQRINALMQTCGFYDEAGEFAFRVGLPGKSGVGGGIVTVHPEKYSAAVWSPKLNQKGNSLLGMETLERLTTKTGLSIF